ncbi:hypothetical protein SAMN02745824_0514 [Parasphingorhabdus marina DSM 22363]|uniref:Lipoprotein n=1 Tax=Parasphingorhabdus marina DSM 22363 TaxID=1123272 RepID=A0A1N6CNA1_9SPHN|nr:hypothetical protein [Parasphingorhabdus marina]SIN59976.1 hypothetical protein SAMN02745824_0514 [Parasphingorhabdus marina DSM 22363]
MKPVHGLSLFVLPLTSACSTLSFAPPSVESHYRTTASGVDCAPRLIKTIGKKPGQKANQATSTENHIPIPQDTVDGARQLTDNFIFAYRCAAKGAANGRQSFEFPALIAAIGAPAVAALDGNPDATVAAGITSAALSAGNGYYGPQQKANILLSGVDALTCIKTVAVGIDPLSVKVGEMLTGNGNSEAQNTKLLNDSANGKSTIEIPYSVQYFDLIYSALLNVDRVVAHRLNNEIVYDAAGVIAQVKELKREEQEGASDGEEIAGEMDETKFMLSGTQTVTKTQLKRAVIKINSLPTKLQECVVRAKI